MPVDTRGCELGPGVDGRTDRLKRYRLFKRYCVREQIYPKRMHDIQQQLVDRNNRETAPFVLVYEAYCRC
jgi:hypothetical protein